MARSIVVGPSVFCIKEWCGEDILAEKEPADNRLVGAQRVSAPVTLEQRRVGRSGRSGRFATNSALARKIQLA